MNQPLLPAETSESVLTDDGTDDQPSFGGISGRSISGFALVEGVGHNAASTEGGRVTRRKRRSRVVSESTDGWTPHMVIAAQSANRLDTSLFKQFGIISEGDVVPGFKYCYDKQAGVQVVCADDQENNKNARYVQLVTLNSWSSELGFTLVGAGLFCVSVHSSATFIAANLNHMGIAYCLVLALLFVFSLNVLMQIVFSMKSARQHWQANVLAAYGGKPDATGDLLIKDDFGQELNGMARCMLYFHMFVFQLFNVPRIIKDAPTQLHPWKAIGQYAALKAAGARFHLVGHRSDYEFRACNREGQLYRLMCSFTLETIMAILQILTLLYSDDALNNTNNTWVFTLLTVIVPSLINFRKVWIVKDLVKDRNDFYALLKGVQGVESADTRVKNVSTKLLRQYFGESQKKKNRLSLQSSGIAALKRCKMWLQYRCRKLTPSCVYMPSEIIRASSVEGGFQTRIQRPKTTQAVTARRMLTRVEDLRVDLNILDNDWKLGESSECPMSEALKVISRLLLERTLPCYFDVAHVNAVEFSPLGFPSTLGPLFVARTHRIEFSSDSNGSLILDAQRRWTLRTNQSCSSALSPTKRLSAHEQAWQAWQSARIPEGATRFAFSYPCASEPEPNIADADPDACFLRRGGFVYLNDDQMVVGVNALVPWGEAAVGFGHPQEWHSSWTKPLMDAGRFQTVTSAHIPQMPPGVYFAWLAPGEQLGEENSVGKHGGFAFVFEAQARQDMRVSHAGSFGTQLPAQLALLPETNFTQSYDPSNDALPADSIGCPRFGQASTTVPERRALSHTASAALTVDEPNNASGRHTLRVNTDDDCLGCESMASLPATPMPQDRRFGVTFNLRFQVRRDFGACALDVASFVIVTEEHMGQCYCYPYQTRIQVDEVFDSRSWFVYSRIVFSSRNGRSVINARATSEVDSPTERRGSSELEEIRTAGPRFAHDTIRKACRLYLYEADAPA